MMRGAPSNREVALAVLRKERYRSENGVHEYSTAFRSCSFIPAPISRGAEDKLGLSTRGRVEAQTFVGAGEPHRSSAPCVPWKPAYRVLRFPEKLRK
jgi:hypothetical protein